MDKVDCERRASLETPDKDLKEIMEEAASKVIKGLYCKIDLNGSILQANDRLKILHKYCYGVKNKKKRRSEVNFFDFVPLNRRKEVFHKITSLQKEDDGSFYGTLSIPLDVENFEYGIKAQIKFSERSFFFLISSNELNKLQNLEFLQIKELIEEKQNMGLWVLDKQGIVLHVIQKNSFKNLGWKAEEIIGMNYLTFVNSMEKECALKENPHKEGVYKIFRRHKCEEFVNTEVVVGQMTLHDGRRYTVHLDLYEMS
jgi:hypothetical protein